MALFAISNILEFIVIMMESLVDDNLVCISCLTS